MKSRLFSLLLLSLLLSVAVLRAQDAPPPVTCPTSQSFRYGLHELTLEVGESTRVYTLYVPHTYRGDTPTPLILSFHAYSSDPGQQEYISMWNLLADQNNLIVAYPQGTGDPLIWNSGPLGFGNGTSADDVGFVSALLDELSKNLCIDTARVYANGLSNGAGMSHRLACELSDRITAIGGVAGYYTLERCEPTRAVPVIAFHGDIDPIVPIHGGNQMGNMPPISDWVKGWSARNNCQTVRALDPIGSVTVELFTDCTDGADVLYYRVVGGGHTWPGGGEQSAENNGPTNRDINATVEMWNFFSQHVIPR